jgi:1,4-alpha-glucan branching enzyme
MNRPLSPQPEVVALLEARHGNAFGFLGRHWLEDGRGAARTFQPTAQHAWFWPEGAEQGLEAEVAHHYGLFEVELQPGQMHGTYEWEYESHQGARWRVRDPYSFGPLLGEQDMHYFREGTHRRLYDCLGAHPVTLDGVAGLRFAVWAPNARRVSVVGDFNNWDGRVHPMRLRIESGIWEIFIPGAGPGTHYKFELLSSEGHLLTKSDPMAFFSQHGTQTASLVFDLDQYRWADDEWMRRRAQKNLYTSR